MIVIDSNIALDFFRDVSPAADVLSDLISRSETALTAISVFELYSVVRGTKRLRQIEVLAQGLFIFPWNTIEAGTAGRIYTELKAREKMIGTRDILIAGICVANDLPLFTKNLAHVSCVEDLRLL